MAQYYKNIFIKFAQHVFSVLCKLEGLPGKSQNLLFIVETDLFFKTSPITDQQLDIPRTAPELSLMALKHKLMVFIYNLYLDLA